jgi:hypothetical protein
MVRISLHGQQGYYIIFLPCLQAVLHKNFCSFSFFTLFSSTQDFLKKFPNSLAKKRIGDIIEEKEMLYPHPEKR